MGGNFYVQNLVGRDKISEQNIKLIPGKMGEGEAFFYCPTGV